MAEFRSLVCAQKCARVLPSGPARLVQWGATSARNTPEPLQPLQFHRRLFVESIYDEDASDSPRTCWLFALHRCSSSGMSLHVLMGRISQMRGWELSARSLTSHPVALGLCAAVRGRGRLCLGISTFISRFLSLKVQS